MAETKDHEPGSLEKRKHSRILHYFPVVMVKYHDQKQLKNERVYFVLQSQRERVPVGGEAWQEERKSAISE